MRFRFEEAARGVEVVQVGEDASFGRTAVARVGNMLDDATQAFEYRRRLLRRH